MSTASTDTNTTMAASVAAHAAIAAYARALDAGGLDAVVDLFWPDGVAEIGGVGTFEGHDAIREGYAAFIPTQPQLHFVGNTVVTSSSADEATATSDLAFFARGASCWEVRLVGRYQDTLCRRAGEWRFQRRVTTFRA
ncbi:nuclear transport factor 2 family protein [Streptomyces sp. NPDC093085]|uniref:nuclear transport factor 2 family protein n=1 Tax=Streptomyces sp. NPDC093085 TaxID=3155068 RepID=UPI003447007D